MHNFPKDNGLGISYFCLEKTETKAQLKEILILALENDVDFQNSDCDLEKHKTYPFLCYSLVNEQITRTSKNDTDADCILTFEQFKAFIGGKGNIKLIKKPYQELQLNSQHKAIITKKSVKVDCQEFSHDIIKKLYLLSQKALKS